MAEIWSFPGEENARSNPYTATLVRELRSLEHHVKTPGWPGRLVSRCDILHLHWPQKVVQPGLFSSLRSISLWLVFLSLQKARGARLVWTVHNVQSHEAPRPRLENWWMQRMLALVDGIHCLSHANLREACAAFPVVARKTPLVAPHWTYDDAYPPASPDLADRRSAVAFLGDLKAYKGVRDFLAALEQAQPDDRRYIVHGKPVDERDAQDLARRLLALRDRGWHLDFVLDRLSNQQMADCLEQTGLLVLPYHRGENSGLAVLAAERGTPLLVSAVPAFESLADELGVPRITPIEAPLTHEQMDRAFRSAHSVAGTIDAGFAARRAPAAVVREISNYYLFLMDR
jgi:glycosyltransferase involved in cell wall biosynthesis